jgi:hypothetical protein
MRDKFVLRLLGLLETTPYTLEQSHGVPPVSVACDHTTLMEEDACGYSSIKTVRSIVNFNLYLDRSGDYLRPHGELAHGKTPRQDASVGV